MCSIQLIVKLSENKLEIVFTTSTHAHVNIVIQINNVIGTLGGSADLDFECVELGTKWLGDHFWQCTVFAKSGPWHILFTEDHI